PQVELLTYLNRKKGLIRHLCELPEDPGMESLLEELFSEMKDAMNGPLAPYGGVSYWKKVEGILNQNNKWKKYLP
ncbi:MAG: hypothetical protein MJ252_02960, partial [archaeon]|nr:hypothetical protein [archaeon]